MTLKQENNEDVQDVDNLLQLTLDREAQLISKCFVVCIVPSALRFVLCIITVHTHACIHFYLSSPFRMPTFYYSSYPAIHSPPHSHPHPHNSSCHVHSTVDYARLLERKIDSIIAPLQDSAQSIELCKKLDTQRKLLYFYETMTGR